jgi:hypothetical protein
MAHRMSIVVLISMVLAGPALAGDYMYGKKYGTFRWTGLTLDHTYHCARNSSGVTTCWSWTGGESGGTTVSGSTGYGTYAKAKCTSTNLACLFAYGVDGVCHQEANRGLRTAFKTIATAAGYNISYALFGTYGKFRSWALCSLACGLP